jgi:SAM-dependent methyltransferase
MKVEFTCNVCNTRQDKPREELTRENPSCDFCGASVRRRSIVHCLSLALFGESLPLPRFPRAPEIAGAGLSDWPGYAVRLADKFTYRNTYYHQAPKLDISAPPAQFEKSLDFLISSDVFEHVLPPVDRAFQGAFQVLKPGGWFVLTVPYSREPAPTEHYPDLHKYQVVHVGGRYAIVNLRRDGRFEVHADPVFHGGAGQTLEMRVLNETELMRQLDGAGFVDVQIHRDPVPSWGIYHEQDWSLPLVARRPL